MLQHHLRPGFLPFLPLFTHCDIVPESQDNPGQSKGGGINHLNPNTLKNGDSFQKMTNPDAFLRDKRNKGCGELISFLSEPELR